MLNSHYINVPAFPPDQFFLERPRINGLLAQALEGHVLVISAGEGYGKTYEVHSFLRNRSETTIWLQLSERDNEPWRFWENYTNTMGLCKAGAGREMREIGFPETAEQFNRWFEIDRREFSYPDKYVIVVDDFHRIRPGAVLDFIERAMSYPIPSHTLILISRVELDINMVPFLSKGRLTRIGAEELLFNEQEIAAYFRLRNMDLSAEELSAIHQDTEGLPLALGMTTTEIKKNGGYTRQAPGEGFFRFFMDDLFASVPKEFQCYLIKLSIFEQWPLSLLEKTAITLPEHYQTLQALRTGLENLSSLIRYDYYLQGYRIHQVFLDYLREQQQELPREEIQTICGIAAKWCLENNLKMDAAINFERAGDYAALVDIMDSFPRFVSRTVASPLLDLIDRLNQNKDRNEEDDSFIYLHYIVRAKLLLCLSRYDEAVAVIRESIKRFEAMPPCPVASRVLAEAWDYMGIVTLIRSRFVKSQDYIHCFEQSSRYYQRHPWPLRPFMNMCSVSSYVAQIGHPAAAGEFERRINVFAAGLPKMANSLNSYLSGMADLAWTELAYFQGDLNRAEQCGRRTVIKAREKNQCEIEHRAFFFLLRICLHRGSMEELLELKKQHETILSIAEYPNRHTVGDIISGWLYIQLGETEKTPPWLRSRFEISELYSLFRNFESLVKAKYLYAEKQYADAAAFLGLPENKESLGSFLLGMIEMNCLEAACRYQLGEEGAAIAILEQTYHEAVLNSITMPFIEMGYAMRSLATAALKTGSSIPRPWLEDIRDRASAYGKNLSILADQHRDQEITQVYLTRQERIVLRFLSQGQTREEIAAATGQTLSAVKSAISRACEKLGAVNRADAVRIALALGILEN
ncbi:hypothetical protein AGMMS50293_22870 [Spirochaetia bacterium]|nr:hypothetical protein AGMMS50293_22870 [Spirochaetia bacterium]